MLEKLGWVILFDYPASQAALAQTEGEWAKRFEFYWRGVELSNGYLELVNAQSNKFRMLDIAKERQLLGKDLTNPDPDFEHALEKGINPCCGNALGLDRWLALISHADPSKGLEHLFPFRKEKRLI